MLLRVILLLFGAIFLVIMLLVPSIVRGQTLPETPAYEDQAVLNDVEMGAKARKGVGTRLKASLDGGVVAQFEREYKAAGRETGPVFEKYLSVMGAQAILDQLEELHVACHGQAHPLGQAIFARVKQLGTALRECQTRCTSGCMHGVVIEAFGGASLKNLKGQMDRFCSEGAMVEIHKPGNCAHGIGHALMAITGDDIQKSLTTCTSFQNPAMAYYCATGVFMEYLVTGRSRDLRPYSPHYPCDTYTQYPAACYRYRVYQMFERLGGDGGLVVKECLALPRFPRLGCFHGLGAAYTQTVLKQPTLLTEVCRYGSQNDQAMCIEGVIEKLADYDEAAAFTACASLGGENTLVCQAAVQGKMYRLGKPTMALYYGP